MGYIPIKSFRLKTRACKSNLYVILILYEQNRFMSKEPRGPFFEYITSYNPDNVNDSIKKDHLLEAIGPVHIQVSEHMRA